VAGPEWQAYDCIPMDADTDGVDELAFVDYYMVQIRKQDFSVVASGGTFVPKSVTYCRLQSADWDGDGKPNLTATLAVPETLLVMAKGELHAIDIRPKPPDCEREWDGSINLAVHADVDGDDSLELVVSAVSGFGWRWLPRGVYAVELPAGDTIWRFGLGPQVRDISAADLDGDGKVEVLLGTGAVGNGCSEGGTSDGFTYVICLDGSSGKPRWVAPIDTSEGSGVSMVKVADIDADGLPEVVALYSNPMAGCKHGRLMVLSSDSGQVTKAVDVDSLLLDLAIDDIDGDGTPEIMVATRSGAVEVYDAAFNRIARTVMPDGVKIIVGSDHLLGIKQKQLLVITNAGRLVILDAELRVQRSFGMVRSPVAAGLLRSGPGKPLGLVVCSEPYVLPHGLNCFTLYRFELLPSPFPWATLSAVLAGLLGIAGSSMVYSRRAHRRQMRGLARGLVQRAGMVELDRRGRVLAANDYARQLLGLEGDWEKQALLGNLTAPEFAPLRDALQRLFAGSERQSAVELQLAIEGGVRTFRARAVRVRFGGFFLSLEDLSAAEYARRVSAWGPVAQRLAHGIKTPLSTIKLKAQQMEEEGVAEAAMIKQEADRLSRMTDGFMRLASFEPLRLEPKDLNAVVRRVVEEQGVALMTGITLKLDLSPNLPPVGLDEDLLARALANLVNNAVTAMEGKGELTLRTRLARDGGQVVVEVADTGPGIPEEYRAKLFQPFFSRKPGGTGLGLAIVKKTAEDHGGTVEFESDVGKGAMFRILLPAGRTTGASPKSEARNPKADAQASSQPEARNPKED
jgi:signal transduction histidine kinase